jgi:hypothetical protein
VSSPWCILLMVANSVAVCCRAFSLREIESHLSLSPFRLRHCSVFERRKGVLLSSNTSQRTQSASAFVLLRSNTASDGNFARSPLEVWEGVHHVIGPGGGPLGSGVVGDVIHVLENSGTTHFVHVPEKGTSPTATGGPRACIRPNTKPRLVPV